MAYEQTGPRDGWPVLLAHGFPYDVRAFDEVVKPLADEGARVIVPYLRGYRPTSFLSQATPRSGEQAALGADLLALLDALEIPEAGLAGYDWGGRAASVVAALWPDRVRFLVCANGYTIQNIAAAGEPALPEDEHRFWYQFYFHGDRGHAGLTRNRKQLCRLLWTLWSPTWQFDDETFARSAGSFDNSDSVEVVIHSYRHRFGLVAGDSALADGVVPARDRSAFAAHVTSHREHLRIPNVGHNIPQESPAAFADAILRLHHDVG